MKQELESLYEVGDIVKIKQLSKEDGYRFGLNGEMMSVSGRTFEIASLEPATCPGAKLPDDGFRYKLKGIGWSWASSMFEESSTKKSTKSKTKKSKIKISFHKKKKLKFNFSL
jgi:hypothetical protein